jgi:hypothetical protein
MKWLASISIKQIAFAFVIGLLFLVVLIGGFAVYQTRSVNRDLEHHRLDAARSELEVAFKRLLVEKAERRAISPARWDETRVAARVATASGTLLLQTAT